MHISVPPQIGQMTAMTDSLILNLTVIDKNMSTQVFLSREMAQYNRITFPLINGPDEYRMRKNSRCKYYIILNET